MPASAIDLCLASTVAGDLGVADDAQVQRAVTAASRAVARYCGRPFERATVTEYPAGYGRPLLLLDRAPIISIASVTEGGTAVDAAGFESLGAMADSGLVLRRGGVWMDTGAYMGRITYGPADNVGRSDGIAVTYTAGYVTPGQKALNAALVVTLPEDVQEAAVLVAAGMLRRRAIDPNVASEGLGDWSVSYRAALPSLVLPEVESVLAPYRSLRVS